MKIREMKVFFHEALESTSATAAEIAADQNQTFPFLVIAQRQTKGRGRRGRTWASPEGNIYFTLALSSNQVSGPRSQEGALPLSLHVALSLQNSIRELCGLHVRIKWPNDLFMEGAKLGGILCETIQAMDSNQSYVLVGIGLNVHCSPVVDAGVSVISIDQAKNNHHLSQKINAKQLAIDLADRLYSSLVHEFPTIHSFTQQAMLSGQLWIDQKGMPYLASGLDKLGGLRLQPVEFPLGGHSQNETIIHSADHDFSLAYMRREKNIPLIIADAGNSYLKICLYADAFDDKPTYALRASYHADTWETEGIWDMLVSWRREYSLPSAWPIYYASVNQGGMNQVTPALQQRGWVLQPIHGRALHVSYPDYATEQMGIDRLAICEAATFFKPYTAKILISVGTCLTVDAVNSLNQHVGGLIAPGLRLATESMSEKAEGLPNIDLTSELSRLKGEDSLLKLGCDTKSAMIQGVLFQVAGMVEILKKRWPDNHGSSLEVWVTGGDGEWVARILNAHYVSDLVAIGLKEMVI